MSMLAREKWQAKTILVLEKVFAERVAQYAKHGDAMLHLDDGTSPEVRWLQPINQTPASRVQTEFRVDYEDASEEGALTRLHLVREELAEAFERDGDDPEFLAEILQVAALCVQWAEYKIDDRGNHAPESLL